MLKPLNRILSKSGYWPCFTLGLIVWNASCLLHAAAPTAVLVVVGPSSHPPGTHEVAAGGRVIEYCLEYATGIGRFSVDVVEGWPKDSKSLDKYRSVVFSGDRFPLAEMEDIESNMRELGIMMERGCGIVCFHYATGLTAGQMPDDGSHPLLNWMGGYFATRCVHHQGIARIYEQADIVLESPQHPVLRGCQPFSIHDEPYIKNYFGPDGIAPNVTPLLTSMLPPESPQKEVIAWSVQRSDGGRGMAIVMPHFYKNWQVDALRKVIINGVVWSTGIEVPAVGVHVELPDLQRFQPAAVEPPSR
ncbi:ThuA domain-containing protein [Aureliella helgolandensis]|uniref:Trehalose utilization n=1 Tax=Aureliella helgolandensis TaxID=2527968 RepID=A0A518G6M6_9BACT|nr:ThuA domain-containing protein [Aureliella helgolandensis]QDV24243.1 Trehalose utilization [Aureliella helgolandensis]